MRKRLHNYLHHCISGIQDCGSFAENKVVISNILFLLISNVSMLTVIYASSLMRYLYNYE